MSAAPVEALRVLRGRRLRRANQVRTVRKGETIIVTAPTRHRPVLRMFLSAVQKHVWDRVGSDVLTIAEIEASLTATFGMSPEECLQVVADLERRGFLVSPGASSSLGCAWPRWKRF